jgi:hypothetical protein
MKGLGDCLPGASTKTLEPQMNRRDLTPSKLWCGHRQDVRPGCLWKTRDLVQSVCRLLLTIPAAG